MKEHGAAETDLYEQINEGLASICAAHLETVTQGSPFQLLWTPKLVATFDAKRHDESRRTTDRENKRSGVFTIRGLRGGRALELRRSPSPPAHSGGARAPAAAPVRRGAPVRPDPGSECD